MLQKEKITVAVHDGRFHADDVLCVAMLYEKYGAENVTVVRTRNPEEYLKCDYVLDVGFKDEITEDHVYLDHHQRDNGDKSDRRIYYEDGVKKAACGKLFAYLYADEPEFRERVYRTFLRPIESADNGHVLQYPHSKLAFVEDFNPISGESKTGDECFLEAVDMVQKIFQREVAQSRNLLRDEQELEQNFDVAFTNNILCLRKHMIWDFFVRKMNKNRSERKQIKFIMIKNEKKAKDGSVKTTYSLYGVPKRITHPFDTKIKFPEEWRGLEGDELNSVCRFGKMLFCHAKGFMATFDNVRDAYVVARSLIERQNLITAKLGLSDIPAALSSQETMDLDAKILAKRSEYEKEIFSQGSSVQRIMGKTDERH